MRHHDSAIRKCDRSIARDVMVVVAGQKRQSSPAVFRKLEHVLDDSSCLIVQRFHVVFDQITVDDQVVTCIKDGRQHFHARAGTAQEMDIRNDHGSTHH